MSNKTFTGLLFSVLLAGILGVSACATKEEPMEKQAMDQVTMEKEKMMKDETTMKKDEMMEKDKMAK